MRYVTEWIDGTPCTESVYNWEKRKFEEKEMNRLTHANRAWKRLDDKAHSGEPVFVAWESDWQEDREGDLTPRAAYYNRRWHDWRSAAEDESLSRAPEYYMEIPQVPHL